MQQLNIKESISNKEVNWDDLPVKLRKFLFSLNIGASKGNRNLRTIREDAIQYWIGIDHFILGKMNMSKLLGHSDFDRIQVNRNGITYVVFHK